MQTYIIIGAQKCGTTSLYKYLIGHPRVAPAVTKEVHYFDLQFEKGDNWYFSQFPGSADRERYLVTGESSPYYLFHPLVAKRLHQLIPDAKLIALLRDPVARAVSHYYHEKLRLGTENLSLEDAFAQESGRLQGETEQLVAGKISYSFNHHHYGYLSRGIYVDQLRAWMNVFPREQFLVLKSEDLYTQPSRTYNRTLEFLGLPAHELPDYPKHYAAEYPPITRVQQQHLVDYFRPHNRRLEEFLGQKFDWGR